MRFRPFPKIPTHRAAPPRPMGGPWVALEKLHGAQLVIAWDGASIHAGKRKAWLAGDEPFFGWQLVISELATGVRAIAQRAAAQQTVKRKLAEFDDDRFGEAEAWNPGHLGEDTLVAWVDRLVQPARLASARSKVGTDPAAIVDEVALDVAVDLGLAFRDAWERLSAAGQDRVLAHARRRAEQQLMSRGS